MAGCLRAVTILVFFLVLTFVLLPFQLFFLRVLPLAARNLPRWYHVKLCKLLGLRIKIEGQIERHSSLLLVSNHTSWMDIPLLSSIAPVSFVAKEEVGSWPIISTLAKLQRTLFINRRHRSKARRNAHDILDRLINGDSIVLFGEGTSTDGNRVLPFKSSLFAAVIPSKTMTVHPKQIVVQTVSLVYKSLYGVPLGWADRPLVSWYGDMEFVTHAWELLKRGPLDVNVSISPPIRLNDFTSRKELADHTERVIQKEVVRLLRGYAADKIFNVAHSSRQSRRPLSINSTSKKWH